MGTTLRAYCLESLLQRTCRMVLFAPLPSVPRTWKLPIAMGEKLEIRNSEIRKVRIPKSVKKHDSSAKARVVDSYLDAFYLRLVSNFGFRICFGYRNSD